MTPQKIMDDCLSDCETEEVGTRLLVKHMIAALNAAGFVIVPKEPTIEMINAGRDVDTLDGADCTEHWAAMIAAASTPQGQKG